MIRGIAIVVSSPMGGGAEKSMTYLHRQLLKNKIDSVLIAINTDSNPPIKKSNAIKVLNRRRATSLLRLSTTLIKFNLVIWKRRPSVLILNCDLPELFGAFSILSLRTCKLVVVEHANPSWSTRRLVGRFVRRILIWRRAKFVSVSKHIVSPFGTHNYEQSIPNFIGDVNNLKIHKSTREITRLVYVGRLTSVDKNPQTLLNVSKLSGIPVTFFGAGELRSFLMKRATSEKIDASFKGWVEDPWSELCPGDLLLVPSEREGDCLVVVESILRKVPMLLRDVPDLRRFGLADDNYCSSDWDFSHNVNEFRFRLQDLIPADGTRLDLIRERNTDVLTKSWISFLSKI